MLTRRVRLQIIAFVVIALVGVSYAGFRYAGLDRLFGPRGYAINVALADSGGIFTGAEVTYRGVTIGRVGPLTLTKDGVRVELDIDSNDTQIPASSQAVVADRSAVGEQYMDLRPSSDSGPYLAAGATIPQARTATPPPVQGLLTNLDDLAGSVPTQSLQTVVDELDTAFQGTGPNLQTLLDTTSSFTQAAAQNLPQTTKLLADGNTVLANMELHREAKTFVEALTKVSGEAVHLCVFDGVQSTLIKRTEPTREHTNTIVVMEASPAHCTSTGKAALAFQSDAVVDRVIGLGLKFYTEYTIVDGAALKAELSAIRKRGYSIDAGELTLGIRCVGAPIRNLSGRVFASISVSGAARRFPENKIPEIGQMVRQYADAISVQLGYRPAWEEEEPERPARARQRQGSRDS